MSFVCETVEVDDDAPSVSRQSNKQRGGVSAWRTHRITRLDIALAAALVGLTLLARAPFILHGEMLLHSDEAIVGDRKSVV